MAGKTKSMSQIKQLLLLKKQNVSNRKAATQVGMDKEKKASTILTDLYVGGEKAFLDYTGDILGYVDRETGEIIKTQTFVASLPASDYGYILLSLLSALKTLYMPSHTTLMTSKLPPEMHYRSCDGLMSLQRCTDPIIFRTACKTAIEHGKYNYKFVCQLVDSKCIGVQIPESQSLWHSASFLHKAGTD